MDFFEAQDRARRRSRWLVLYFGLAVLGIALTIYLVCAWWWGLEFGASSPSAKGRATVGWWHPKLFLYSVVGTLAVVGLGSLYRMSTLRAGGRSVAEALGGRLIRPDTRDVQERRLLNVVEEMALASGLPVPPVYVLDDEPGINAFAAGHGPRDAVIGVTRGCLQLLSRDELQGVIAHEFSHILNGDMRLNLRLIGWIFGIFCLSEIGRILLRTRGRNNPLPFLGLVLMVLGAVGVFFGRLIQAAVSRQREFLADAAAVQFTRNPQGLAGALRKIGGLVHGSRVDNPRALEAAHLFFSSAFGRSALHWFATHPPLEARIRRLDPAWDGTYPRVVAFNGVAERASQARPLRSAGAVGLDRDPASVRQVVGGVGRPGPAQVRFAGALRQALAPELAHAVRDPTGAQAVVLGLVLSPDSELRHQQKMGLQTRLPASVFNRLLSVEPWLAGLPRAARLPLVQWALPALRLLDGDAYIQFRHALRWLMRTDRQMDLFEYALQRMVDRNLEPAYGPVRPRPVQYYSLRGLEPEVRIILSALAWLGHPDPEQARRSYEVGWASLGGGEAGPPMLGLSECGLDRIDDALERLAEASPAVKRRLLAACADAVASDGWLREEEAELLRAVADALDCPVPPLVSELAGDF